MNGTEQKNHKRVTDAIANDVAAIAEATADRLDAIERSVGVERTHRLTMAKEQRAYVDIQDARVQSNSTSSFRAAQDELSALRDRGFWGRMKWIVRGL